ncbi:hypothetical protein HPC49_06210 [Pyxidicoccus fallax]|uniref:Uncharacterized protein n=1 Tax=Pyxidicoccus fallax TaxID=394095 RepID=A0A848LCG5_9BACT|nr:hypothetical protein [Pyxidicoccus fallax]NMO16760.1 hypothetical protein [Pyxidicoccus fallax]NPC77847.1 hypothetical protein [Pyxidicoccus fallax]
MRARWDMVGLGGVVLGIVMLAAGVPLLVPTWMLEDAPPRPAPEGHPRREAPAVARAEAAPPERKDAQGPGLQVELARGREGVTVEVARAREEPAPLARFAKQALVPLTPDEEALLREEPVDDLAALVARTERAFQDATPQTRAEKERRYLAALNLAAKLATPPEPSAADARAREVDARYQRALAEERGKWKDLPPEEQARQQDAFKEWFFGREETR